MPRSVSFVVSRDSERLPFQPVHSVEKGERRSATVSAILFTEVLENLDESPPLSGNEPEVPLSGGCPAHVLVRME
jgi:hypothetical protein